MKNEQTEKTTIAPPRAIIAFLWRSTIFRVMVIYAVQYSPPTVANWIAVKTPFLYALRQTMLNAGRWDLAADAAALLRQANEL